MHKISHNTFLRTQNRLKNETLYTLLRTNFVYQGGRSFKCPKTFLHVVNERILMVAKTWSTEVPRGISRTPVTCKMAFFVSLIKCFSSLVKVKERSISDTTRVRDSFLVIRKSRKNPHKNDLIKFINMFSRFIFIFFAEIPSIVIHF